MCNQYEIYKASVLIKMLIRRNQPVERAKEVYPKKIYESALKNLQDEKGLDYAHTLNKKLIVGLVNQSQGVLI